MIAADAKALEGQVLAARGEVEAATACLPRSCSRARRSVGSDREAAQLWFELAGLLEEVGELDAARDAYRSAAAASGVKSRPRIKAASAAEVRVSN